MVNKKWVALAVATALIVSMVYLIAGQVDAQVPTPAPTPTLTPAPINSPALTPTPTPIRSPIATSAPTPASSPTPTSASGPPPTSIPFSIPYPLSLLASVLMVLLAYYTAAQSVANAQQPRETRKFSLSWRDLNPVVITSGKFGKASLSRLQVFCFSLIVLGLLVYILLTTGQLSDVSEGVLTLLGISLTGAVLSKGIEVATQRLTNDNWTWLRNQGWLTAGEKGWEEKPSNPRENAFWKDLITTGGSFDVYRFQMFVFSILVGVSLIIVGLSTQTLRAFSLPSGFAVLLGLSEGFYIFGKAVDPKSFEELNSLVDSVREADLTWRKQIVDKDPNDIPRSNCPEADRRISESDARNAAPEASQDYFHKALRAATLLKSLFDSVEEGTKFKNSPISEADVLPNWLQPAK